MSSIFNKTSFFYLKIFFLVESVLVTLFSRPTPDDGVYISASYFILKGLMPFVDFSYGQGPILPFIYAPFIYILGTSFTASKILGLISFGLIYFYSIKISQLFIHDKSKGNIVKCLITLAFMSQPEIIGALTRYGSRGAVVSLILLFSIYQIVKNQKIKMGSLWLAAFGTAILIGIKYTHVIIIPPMMYLIYVFQKKNDAILFLTFLIGSLFLIFMPYYISGNFDSVIFNYNVTVSYNNQNQGIINSILFNIPHTLLSVGILLIKIQILCIPLIIYLVYNVKKNSLSFILSDINFLLILFFSFCSLGLLLGVSPGVFRTYRFIPLLYIAFALCTYSILYNKTIFNNELKGVSTFLIIFFFIVNLRFWIADYGYNDSGFSAPDRTFVKSLLSKSNPIQNEIASVAKDREVLYIGTHQYKILSNSYSISPYSIKSLFALDANSFDLQSALNYKLLNIHVLNKLILERKYCLVIDKGALNQNRWENEKDLFLKLKNNLDENYFFSKEMNLMVYDNEKIKIYLPKN